MSVCVIRNSLSCLPVLLIAALVATSGATAVCGQESQVAKALAIKPKQADASEYDNPTEDEAEGCVAESSRTVFSKPGWIVKDAAGRMLRVFLDTNDDKKLDQWSFFRNGLEVYRDLDTNANGKPDEHRWVGNAGTRWGLDRDEDGKIDSWKMISSEEAAQEAFLAVAARDRLRFQSLLATPEELKRLGFGESVAARLAASLKDAGDKFDEFASGQQQIKADTRFVQFSPTRPSLLIAGTAGSNQDLLVFDQSSAMFEVGDQLEQLSLGTMIRIDDAWRLVELPSLIQPGLAATNGGVFFPLPGVGDMAATGPVSDETQKLNGLFEKWQKLDEQLKDAKSGAATEKLQAERIDVLLDLAQASPTPEDRRNWIRQLTDTAIQGLQKDLFTTAPAKLKEVAERLKKAELAAETDYIFWSLAAADYATSFSDDPEKRNAATEKFMTDLEAFVDEFPKSEFASDALMQLALHTEVNVSGGAEKSLALYSRVAKDFPESNVAKKAAGAVLRLSAVGKAVPLKGQTFGGQPFDLADKRLRGKIVVIYYWATWGGTTTDDFADLQRLAAKYKEELVIVGACLDQKRADAEAFLKKSPNVSWPNLFEEGGVDESPLAIQLGVSGPPLVVLVDEEGLAVDTTLTIKDLDREIQRLIRRREK